MLLAQNTPKPPQLKANNSIHIFSNFSMHLRCFTVLRSNAWCLNPLVSIIVTVHSLYACLLHLIFTEWNFTMYRYLGIKSSIYARESLLSHSPCTVCDIRPRFFFNPNTPPAQFIKSATHQIQTCVCTLTREKQKRFMLILRSTPAPQNSAPQSHAAQCSSSLLSQLFVHLSLEITAR